MTLSPSQQAKLLTVILMLSPEAHICDLFWSKTHSSWSQVPVEQQVYPQICFHTQLCITASIPLPFHPFQLRKGWSYSYTSASWWSSLDEATEPHHKEKAETLILSPSNPPPRNSSRNKISSTLEGSKHQ